MADVTIAGLPRLTGVVQEVRLRGLAALGLGVSAAAWWALAWLLGLDVSVRRTLLSLGMVALFSLILGLVASGRRLRAGRDPQPPPRPAVYETMAAARERRVRMVGVAMLGVVILLAFDHPTGGSGEMAGLLTGLLLPVGGVDLREARLWAARQALRPEGGGLYLLVRPNALMAGLGPAAVYERPVGD